MRACVRARARILVCVILYTHAHDCVYTILLSVHMLVYVSVYKVWCVWARACVGGCERVIACVRARNVAYRLA